MHACLHAYIQMYTYIYTFYDLFIYSFMLPYMYNASTDNPSTHTEEVSSSILWRSKEEGGENKKE